MVVVVGGHAVPGMMDEEVGVIIAGWGTGGLLSAGIEVRGGHVFSIQSES